MSSRKGQTMSADFLLSLALFLVILALIIPLWDVTTTSFRDRELQRDIVHTANVVADLLVESQGSPPTWNATHVSSIGLANADRTLNVSKLHQLVTMEYASALGALKVGYYVYTTFEDIDNKTLYTGAIALPLAYISGGNHDIARLLTEKNVSYDEIDTVAQGGMANAINGVTANLTYRTLVLEDATSATVNVAHLRSFVRFGGIIIYEGDPTPILNDLEVTYTTGTVQTGTPTTDTHITATPGTTVQFDDAQGALTSNHVKQIIRTSGGHAATGWWNIGDGAVYYVADINATVQDAQPDKLENRFALIGEKAVFGQQPINPSFVASVERFVLIEKTIDMPGIMKVLVWA